MRLIIGGTCNGKLLYAMERYHVSRENVAESFAEAENKPIFCRFHQAVRETLEAGGDPAAELERLLRVNPDVIIICDEVGCGVVPVDREERLWRETVGRLCCLLARRAESVERVFYGIPMELKLAPADRNSPMEKRKNQ